MMLQSMRYAAATVQNFDRRLNEVVAEFNTALPGVDFDTVIKDIIAGDGESLSNTMDLIDSENILSDDKVIVKIAEDLLQMVIQRENYLTEYENIKANPGYYSYAPPATDVEDDTEEILDDEVNTVVVSGKDENTLVGGNRYYVGQGIDFDTAKAVDEPLLIPEFQVLGKNDDGSVQIKITMV